MSALRLALATAAFAVSLPALAEDKVVAEVNGTKLHASALTAYQRSLPPQMGMNAPYGALLDMVVNNHLLAEQAKKDGVANDPEVKMALKQFEQQLMAKAWMSQKLKAAVTEDVVKRAYDKFLGEFKPVEEVRASHVLAQTEDEAKAVIAELKKGADFAETAKARSKDPSARQNGGDLGYFTADEMVKEFSDAAFAMKPGELAAAPVKSQFGFHVIKVEDRRMASPPTLEQARPVIREQLAQEAAQKLVADIREKAKVKLYDPEGKPMEATKGKP
ncbi:peptidylprolyl isomerase [Magnetospirillum sp. UT-4]|uniref:peptidylprolyl isomerase n=1 Tax=Magnetospirillum sp. UT-4 TaxID=2681467 RepID=UPI0020C44715|nr:peptidylprolyl isomerase [Magnetospirillum sp. UT-4]